LILTFKPSIAYRKRKRDKEATLRERVSELEQQYKLYKQTLLQNGIEEVSRSRRPQKYALLPSERNEEEYISKKETLKTQRLRLDDVLVSIQSDARAM